LVLLLVGDDLQQVASDFVWMRELKHRYEPPVHFSMLTGLANRWAPAVETAVIVLLTAVALLAERLQVLYVVGPAPALRHLVVYLQNDSVVTWRTAALLATPEAQHSRPDTLRYPEIISLGCRLPGDEPISGLSALPYTLDNEMLVQVATPTIKLFLRPEFSFQTLANLKHC
jgi:hypothetical protein